MIDLNNIDDIDDELNELEQLEDLFDDLDFEEPSADQMYKMYGIFLNDIVNKAINIKGVDLSFDRNKSKHPLCRGKFRGFEHIITRKSEHSGKRHFDRERANKIHWIRPVIENTNDSRIKYFEKVNSDGFNQQFYWYKEKRFVVIIRELIPEYFIITAFCVDNIKNNVYQRDYDEYRAK